LTPTAKQVVVLGHETDFRVLIPAGKVSSDHERPPFAVDVEIDPVPALPLFPTDTQSRNVEQETPVRSIAASGTVWVVQWDPSSLVPITYVLELKLVPTAIQVVSTGQEIAVSSDPEGIELVGVHAGGLIQGLLLLRVVGPPTAIPEATQFSVVAHEIDESDKTDGWSSWVQCDPSCVPMIAGFEETTPTATHVIGPGHETLDSDSNPVGCVWGFQEVPSDVPRISEPPTAVQLELAPHEMERVSKVSFWRIQLEPPSIVFKIPVAPPA
jgi:hypothetical protein